MNVNPYWVGFISALSQYPGVQWMARRAKEIEEGKAQRERLSQDMRGIFQVATAQQAKEISRGIEVTSVHRGRVQQTALPRPIGRKPTGQFTRKFTPALPQIPVGERASDGKVTFLLRADVEGELNTGLHIHRGQHLTISVTGTCPLSSTLLVNPGGIEMRRGRVHGNPIVRPDATYPDVPCGSVVARLPTTKGWPVKGHWEGPAPTSGDLHLAINDVPHHYKDNRGSKGEIVVLAVTVGVT